jgi:hypothetical protein
MGVVRYKLNDTFTIFEDSFYSLLLRINDIASTNKFFSRSFEISKYGVMRSDKGVMFFYDKGMLKTFLSNFRLFLRGFAYGFYIELLTVGVGYRFERLYKNSPMLTMNLGYSHLIYYKIPEIVNFRVSK